MKNGLYRVEVDMSFPNLNTPGGPQNPGTDDCSMITNKNGLFFAKMHPVKITAKPKTECFACQKFKNMSVYPLSGEPVYVKYCPNCGRNLEVTE